MKGELCLKRTIAIVLVAVLLLAVFCGCGGSPSTSTPKPQTSESTPKPEKTEEPEPSQEPTPTPEPIKGKWVLSETLADSRDDYVSEWGEFKGTYTAELYEHTAEWAYTPDPDDPSDGPVPYSGSFRCKCSLPKEIYPGETWTIVLSASADYDEKPSRTGGICCTVDLHDMVGSYESSGGLKYTDNMFYPVFAGDPTEYGHTDDTYSAGMTDTITFHVPLMTSETYLERHKDQLLFFNSNAGSTYFIYSWIPD